MLKRALNKYKLWSLGVVDEGFTSGVWPEKESILIELPKVSEVAINHCVFSKVWLVTWL